MSFNFDFVNYSNYDVPLQVFNFAPRPYTTVTKTIDGKEYTINIDYDRRENVARPSTTTSNFEIPSIYYAIKAKDKELYLLWYINKMPYDSADIRLYITHSLDNPKEINLYNATFVSNNGKHELYMFINTYNNYIYLGYEKETRGAGEGLLGVSLDEMSAIFGEFEGSLYSNIYGNASGEEGYKDGTFDNTSDIIDIPTKPLIGVSTAGFINVYNIDNNSLINLGSEIFPKYETPPPIVEPDNLTSALVNGLNEQIKALGYIMDTIANKNIVDYVIDCHCIPVKPSYGESESIKIGGRVFSPIGKKVSSDYIDFDCGSLSIKEYYNNFIDYVGTRAKLYLPFIGFVPLQSEYFQNGTLTVKYRFNVIDGSFMCYIIASSSKSQLKDSVIASYGGNACVHIPLTGLNYSNMISSVLNGTTATVANITSGNLVSGVNSAINTLATKPDMQSSNGYNSTSAYLGIRYPYLIIEREVSNFSEYYTSENGLPCNITKSISELNGYVEMDNIHMETLTCTDEEKMMIEDLLKNGIIV